MTYFLATIAFWIIVAITAYIWTAVKILTDNSMTKHKKVCDLCFRDIKKWHELNKIPHPKLIERIKRMSKPEKADKDYYPYTSFDDRLVAYKQNVHDKLSSAVHPDHLKVVRAQLDNLENMWRKEWGLATPPIKGKE